MVLIIIFQMDSVIEISKKRWDKYRQENFENVIEYIKRNRYLYM